MFFYDRIIFLTYTLFSLVCASTVQEVPNGEISLWDEKDGQKIHVEMLICAGKNVIKIPICIFQ